jgi:hypothetical protein
MGEALVSEGVQDQPETVPETEGAAQAIGLALRRDEETPRLGCKTPIYASRAIAQWSPVSIAMALDRGLIVHTPFEFTRAGWRWLRRSRIEQEAAS